MITWDGHQANTCKFCRCEYDSNGSCRTLKPLGKKKVIPCTPGGIPLNTPVRGSTIYMHLVRNMVVVINYILAMVTRLQESVFHTALASPPCDMYLQ